MIHKPHFIFFQITPLNDIFMTISKTGKTVRHVHKCINIKHGSHAIVMDVEELNTIKKYNKNNFSSLNWRISMRTLRKEKGLICVPIDIEKWKGVCSVLSSNRKEVCVLFLYSYFKLSNCRMYNWDSWSG